MADFDSRLSAPVRQLRRLISSPHVLVRLDGTIEFADPAFAQHIGREHEELAGKSFLDLVALPRDSVIDQIFLFSCSPDWLPARLQLTGRLMPAPSWALRLRRPGSSTPHPSATPSAR